MHSSGGGDRVGKNRRRQSTLNRADIINDKERCIYIWKWKKRGGNIPRYKLYSSVYLKKRGSELPQHNRNETKIPCDHKRVELKIPHLILLIQTYGPLMHTTQYENSCSVNRTKITSL